MNFLPRRPSVHVVTPRCPLVDLPWPHDLVVGVLNELVPVRQPADEAWQCEEHREVLCRDSNCLVNDSRVEVHVRVKLPLDKVVVAQGNPLQLDSHVDQGLLPSDREHFFGDLAHDLGSRIVVLVDTVAESHQHASLVLHVVDKLRDVLGAADFAQHFEDGFIGAAVSWPVQSRDGASQRRVYVSKRRRHVPNRSSRAVQLVFRMQDEQSLERADDFGIARELVVAAKSHVQEVLHVAESRVRLDDIETEVHSVACSCDRRSTTDDSVDVNVSLLLGLVAELAAEVSWVRLGMQGGEASDDCLQHAHWVSVLFEVLDEWVELWVVLVVAFDSLGEHFELPIAWQLAVDEQERDLEEVGVLCELLDRVAAVLEDSFLAVDERYAGDAVDGVHVGWVEGASDFALLIFDGRELSSEYGAILDLKLVRSASPIVND